MHLYLAIMPAKLQLLLRTEVLVAEENDAALSDEQGELVALLGGQVFELETDDFGADVGCQVDDFFGGGEEGGFGWVGAGAGVGVGAVCVAEGVDVLEVEGAGWAVLGVSCESILRWQFEYVRTG